VKDGVTVGTNEDLKGLFKAAADIASNVPDDLRPIAFQRALDALIGTSLPADAGSGTRVAPSTEPRQPTLEDVRSQTVARLLEAIDRTEHAAVLAGRKTLDRALLVLRAAQHHNVDALSANDIAQILTQKFREPAKVSAVRMALDRSPAYTDRRPRGGTFVYSLMAPGERYLEGLAMEHPRSSRVPRRGSSPKSTSGTKDGTKRAAVSKPALRTGRPGPKVMLESLIADGYFAKPRVIGDMLKHIEEKKTHRYATSDFTATLQRLVRQSKLERSRNAQGQYEYKAK
jgi:hypothetical protein